MEKREPIFNAPGVVVGLLAVLVAIHLARLALDPEDGKWWLLALAFIPARYAGFAADLPGGTTASVTSFLTHMLVHADFVHLTVNGAWLLAFGSVMARRIGSLNFLALCAASGIAGATTFLAFHPGMFAPVIGASGAVSGLMGGVMRFLFTALNEGRTWQLREAPQDIRRMNLIMALMDRRVLMTTIFFVVFNLMAIWGFGSMGSAGAIAWEAHLGGYFFGLLAFALFDGAPQHPSPTPPNVE